MQIDRRITNGLAWAGAALVIAIPLADFAVRQFSDDTPRAAVVSDQPVSAETPAPQPVQTAQAPQPSAPAPAPVASSGTDDAVDRLIQSGRPLPSYISDGGAAPAPAPKPAQPAPAPVATQPQTPAPAAPKPAAQPSAAQPAPAQPAEAQRPRIVTVTMPTPVSQRPQPRPAAPVVTNPAPVIAAPQPATQPPLIVDDPGPLFTAEDLEDWESGPLDEFLANRARSGGRNATVYPDDYDPNGFFLDQGPNPAYRQRAPVITDEYYFPFGQ